MDRDRMDEIQRRLRASKLQARREFVEIERTSLLREITSPMTSEDRRDEAIKQRDALTTQREQIQDELTILQTANH